MNGHLAINARLNGFAGLSSLVSTRIYPDVMPDLPVYPAVTYHQISSSSAKGALSDPPLVRSVFQVTAWAKSRIDARQVADQIRKSLDRYRQVTIASVKVDDCFYEDDSDLYDPDTKIYFVPVTFRFHYRES